MKKMIFGYACLFAMIVSPAMLQAKQEENAPIKTIAANAKKNTDEGLKILKVEKSDKKGLPQTVLLNGGGTMVNDDRDAKKVVIGVYVPEVVGGYKRDRQIGELKVIKIENEVIICEVKSGAKEIGDGLKANTKFLIKIIPKK